VVTQASAVIREFDVVVVGAGPAGIAAASVCATHGLRVAIVDQSFREGGQIWRHRDRASVGRQAAEWLARLDASTVTRFLESTVVDIDAQRIITASGREGVFRLRGSSLVLAVGARELFLPFPGWTLPGVLGAGGAQALLKEGLSFAGKRIVVAGSGPLLLPVAAALADAGAQVMHILEQAGSGALARFGLALIRTPARLLQAARYASEFGITRYSTGAWVTRAHGEKQLEAVEISVRGTIKRVECDVLCTGYGLVPSIELARAAGCEIAGGFVRTDDKQRTSLAGFYCAGEQTGIAGVDSAVAQGINAGMSIAGAPAATAVLREVTRGREMAAALAQAFRLRSEVLNLAQPDTIICRCEDVRERDVDRSLGWRELKLLTRVGMGPCQGRVCGAAMSARFGIGPEDSRAPIFPVPVSALMRTAPHGGSPT
jgi:NADPH-dependent 2,4-dienoyl-CoA reductase/sulfur reductase-like enzyme